MTIISKNSNNIINFEQVTGIFIGGNSTSIKVHFIDGSGCELEKYCSPEESVVAMQMLSEKIGKVDVFKMPTEKEIQAYMVRVPDNTPKHISGKKSKGHGGS